MMDAPYNPRAGSGVITCTPLPSVNGWELYHGSDRTCRIGLFRSHVVAFEYVCAEFPGRVFQLSDDREKNPLQ